MEVGVSPAGRARRVVFLILAAVLLGGAAAQDSAGPGEAIKDGAVAAAPAVRPQRLSPACGYPSLGPLSAANTLIFFMDYQCPVCPRAAREMDRLVQDFNGDLRVEIHHNPLAMHRNAFEAAAAAKAAQRQGKFWEYHEALLNAPSLGRDALIGLAAALGLDRDAFAHDLDDPALRDQVSAEAKEAQDANALATPGFLINDHAETGWASLPWLEQIIRAHLATAARLP